MKSAIFFLFLFFFSFSLNAQGREEVKKEAGKDEAQKIVQGASFYMDLKKTGSVLYLTEIKDENEIQTEFTVTDVSKFLEIIQTLAPVNQVTGYPELKYGWNYMKNGAAVIYDIKENIKIMMDFKDMPECAKKECSYSDWQLHYKPLSFVGDIVSYWAGGGYMWSGAMHPYSDRSIYTYNLKTKKGVNLWSVIQNPSELVEQLLLNLHDKLNPDSFDAEIKAQISSIKNEDQLNNYMNQHSDNCDFPWSLNNLENFAITDYDSKSNKMEVRLRLIGQAAICRDSYHLIKLSLTPTAGFKEELLKTKNNQKGLFFDIKRSIPSYCDDTFDDSICS